MTCPCCGNVTPVESVKKQFKEGKTSEKILAVIYESNIGKQYHLPSSCSDYKIIKATIDKPTERMAVENNRNFNTPGWGIDN